MSDDDDAEQAETSTSRAAALDVLARIKRAGYDLHPTYVSIATELLDLAFETHGHRECGAMLRSLADEELPTETHEVSSQPISPTGEPLAGNLKVTGDGLTFSV